VSERALITEEDLQMKEVISTDRLKSARI